MAYIENDSYTVYGTEFPYCEFPKAELVFQRVPMALPNVSTVSNYSKADKEILAEIAGEIGDEISALYESNFFELEDETQENIRALSAMAFEVATNARTINAENIETIRTSPIYDYAKSLLEFYGITNNVVIRMTSPLYLEVFAVDSDYSKAVDKVSLMFRLTPTANGFDVMVNSAGELSGPIREYRTILEFWNDITEVNEIAGKRNNSKRNDSFRSGKGARVKAKHRSIRNNTADVAIAAVDELTESQVIEIAKEFGYVPLPNFQGERNVSEEDKKTRASMKKRNQRARAKALESMDARKLEIIAAIDAITENRAASKKDTKAVSMGAIVPPKSGELENLKARNKAAKKSAQIIDHEKLDAELDARLAAYASKALASK